MRRLRIRPISALTALLTVGAMVAMGLALPFGSAASSPEREFSSSFESQCVLAPGVLNERGTVKFATHVRGPEEVHSGEEVAYREPGVTITLPSSWTEIFASIGARELKTRLTHFQLDAAGMQPPTVNLAGSEEAVPIEREKTTSFRSSSSSFTEKVTAAAGEHAGLSVDASPAFEEVEAGKYKETGAGIVFTVELISSTGEHLVGPLSVTCNAPAGVTLASYVVGGHIIVCTTTTPRPLSITLEPNQGPESGGTEVTIHGEVASPTEVFFGGVRVSFQPTIFGPKVVSPPGHGRVSVVVLAPGDECGNGHRGEATFTYTATTEKLAQNGWVLSGSITDKKLGQAITLPEGSTFNGSGELNTATGAGTETGSVSIPPFSASLKLFGVLPVNLGLSLTQSSAISGTIAKSETVAGDEHLSLPIALNLRVTSVGILGLSIPTSCATIEPLALGLAANLTREELLTTGWSFAGAATLARFRCEGALLGRLFGGVLTGLLSGEENAYAISIKPPGG
jgi:hypothetical protein